MVMVSHNGVWGECYIMCVSHGPGVVMWRCYPRQNLLSVSEASRHVSCVTKTLWHVTLLVTAVTKVGSGHALSKDWRIVTETIVIMLVSGATASGSSSPLLRMRSSSFFSITASEIIGKVLYVCYQKIVSGIDKNANFWKFSKSKH